MGIYQWTKNINKKNTLYTVGCLFCTLTKFIYVIKTQHIGQVLFYYTLYLFIHYSQCSVVVTMPVNKWATESIKQTILMEFTTVVYTFIYQKPKKFDVFICLEYMEWKEKNISICKKINSITFWVYDIYCNMEENNMYCIPGKLQINLHVYSF